MVESIKTTDNSEIEQALKEFDAKSGADEIQKSQSTSQNTDIPSKEAPGIKFETDSYKVADIYDRTDTPKMIKLIMKLSFGRVTQERQAIYILIAIFVVSILLSIYIFRLGGPDKPKVPIIHGGQMTGANTKSSQNQ